MVDAVVLAAGRSRRMGTQKLLLPFAGQSVIGHVVDQLFGHVRNVFVVVSGDAEDVRGALSGKRVSVVVNPDKEAEMLSSVRVGLRPLAADVRAALIVLGDQPSIDGKWIARLAESFKTGNKGIIAPTYAGKRGHPLLVAARYFDEIQNCYDEVGLRGLLAAHPDDIEEIAVPEPGVLTDMDYPQDYERELARFNAGRT